MASTLRQQVEQAQAEVRKLKKVNPHLFPEYGSLLTARTNLEEARRALEQAQEAWDQLGQPPGYKTRRNPPDYR